MGTRPMNLHSMDFSYIAVCLKFWLLNSINVLQSLDLLLDHTFEVSESLLG